MKITRNEVAKAAGVSTATVSRVFNQISSVDEELRAKVLAVARELDYKPNAIARSLKTKETKQLAYIVDDISNPLYSEVAVGFQQEAMKHGYMVNLCIADEILDKYLESFINHRIEGILVGSMPKKLNLEKLENLARYGIAIVMNRAIKSDSAKISILDSDFEEGISKAMIHLCGLGHRKIGYIDGLGRDTEYDIRYKTYVKFILDNNLPFDTNYVVFNESGTKTDFRTGHALMEELLNRKTDLTAVMCTNDFMALGAMIAIQKRGLKIPKDISVVGYDNIIFSEATFPGLTTVNLPKFELGVRAVELIMLKKNGNPGVYEKLPTDLVIRGSTGATKEKC